MGGNALKSKGIETRRYDDEEYKDLCNEMLQTLTSLFPENRFHIVQAYHNKLNHGDMDVIISGESNDEFLEKIEVVKEYFKPRAFYKNSDVFSFDYKEFQIDLIYSHNDYFDYQSECMDFDPTLNLMGKTYYKKMTSLKNKGLYFVYRRNNGQSSKDILLTRDMRKTFEFGGFDYDRYLEGFDDLLDIFDWVIASDGFNFEDFKLEKLTQKNRKRNRKRPTFNQFITYCNETIDAGYDLNEDRTYLYEGKNFNLNYEQKEDREECIAFIDDFFPEVKIYEQIELINTELEEKMLLAEKFNGKLVMNKFPELIGKELGRVMKAFYELYDPHFIMNHTEEYLLEKVEELLKNN